MKFHSTVQLKGKTATGIPVPAEVIEALGSGKRPAVSVTIGDYTYRTTVGSVEGEFMIPVSGEVREKAGIVAGDQVDVNVELDSQPREVTIPPDLADALGRDPEAKRFFEGLNYSSKRRVVDPIEQAKTDETRQRRIEKAINSLHEGRI